MDGMFFTAMLAMTALALLVVAGPLLPRSRRRTNDLSLVMMFGCIGSGIVLYGTIGNPALSAATPVTTDKAKTTVTRKAGKAGSIASLVGGLEERLKREPDDAGGWLLLARSYQHLGRNEKAKLAFEKAKALGKSDIAFEAQLGASDTALISGRVELDPDAGHLVQPGDSVFIVAKTTSGTSMPLAVIKRAAAELPFDFALDDTDSMLRGHALSNATDVVVTAKVSSTGDAVATGSGLRSADVKARVGDAATVSLLISDSATTTGGLDNE